MTIAFYSNFINHHQVWVADELYKLTNGHYTFVEMTGMPERFKQTGYQDFSCRPYVLKSWENAEAMEKAKELAIKAEVMIVGGYDALPLEILRCRNTDKLVFDVSERWLKHGIINLFSPRLLKKLWYYHSLFYKKNIYKLCYSSFTANDMYFLHAYRDKCYKWGYFTKVDEFDVESYVKGTPDTSISLIWCARFLKWKHPELAVKLAKRLKENGYRLTIDMFGSGVELDNTKQLCNRLGVEDVISFKGNKPNDEIIIEMRKHDIFLFTSDKNEGWGAVLNEAMSNGCAVVASNQIGSVPFLVKDGVNGMVFESENLESLYTKVVQLIEHPVERKRMVINAYHDMKNIWSPKMAARMLLTLIDDLQHGRDSSIVEGPCSKALPI